jgi:hypothetical protein
MQLARRPARVTDELQPIRDAVCLDAYNDLISVGSIAKACGKSRVTIWRWIKRAKDNPRPPDLTIWANDGGKYCRHRKPIVPGMPVLCIECWATGNPEHPALRRGRISEAPQPDKNLSAGEIAASVQSQGTPAFIPKIRQKKSQR